MNATSNQNKQLKIFCSSDKSHDNCIHVKLSIDNFLLHSSPIPPPPERQTLTFSSFPKYAMLLSINMPILQEIDNVTQDLGKVE